MTAPRFPTHKEAREAKWFSRRHETPDALASSRGRFVAGEAE